MADYLEIARRVAREIKEGRNPSEIRPTQPQGKNPEEPFSCPRCGTRFDTSIGKAWHEANNCADVTRPPENHVPLVCCSKCGSLALYREKNGTRTCQTCEAAS